MRPSATIIWHRLRSLVKYLRRSACSERTIERSSITQTSSSCWCTGWNLLDKPPQRVKVGFIEEGRYFSLMRFIISKKRLQSYIWLETVIVSGGHLRWSSIFKDTVFLWSKLFQSSLFQRRWVNSQFQSQPSIQWMALFILQKSKWNHAIFQIYCVFSGQELLVRRYNSY